MFEQIRNSRRIVQIILVLLIVPFALFGVESYMNGGGEGEHVAEVGDMKISRYEFDEALRKQQDSLRERLGPDFKPEMLNTPQVRLALVESLINQRLLFLEAFRQNLTVTDTELRRVIASIPSLQVDGKFSRDRYLAVLNARGRSEAQFEAEVRQELMLQQIAGAISEAGIPSEAAFSRWMASQTEERTLVEARLDNSRYLAKQMIDAKAIKAEYDANQAAYYEADRIRVAYVTLSQKELAQQAVVSDDDIRKSYEARIKEFQVPEERRASHILLSFAADASPDAKEKLRQEAEALANTLRQSPNRFSELAKTRSSDPGSASQGGDLGYFKRGNMVKSFDDAAFAMKKGEVSDVVESEYGLHIIRLTDIRPGSQKPLSTVRDEIVAGLKLQISQAQFHQSAELFSNVAYEQPDTLDPLVERFKLKPQQSEWITRGASTTEAPFNNPKLMAAVFSDDVRKHHRNSEAVEIESGVLVVARVIEDKPAALKPLDEVSAEIETRLKQQGAATMAEKEGGSLLADLSAGKTANLTWSKPITVSRISGNLPVPARQAVLKAQIKNLPAYVGVALADGYRLYRIDKVGQGEEMVPMLEKVLKQQFSRAVAQEDFSAYLQALRARYGVKVFDERIGNSG